MSKSYPTGGFGYQESKQYETKIDSRKSSFGKIARLMQNAGTAWPTSYPGQPFLAFDALPGSSVPDQLTLLGYDVVPEGDGQRILSHGITETYLIEGSTIPVVRHHAGIIAVKRWVLDL